MFELNGETITVYDDHGESVELTLEQEKQLRDLYISKKKNMHEVAGTMGIPYEDFLLAKRALGITRKSDPTPIIENAVRPIKLTEGGPVGVIPDLHIPFEHPYALRFVKETFEKYKVSKIVCLGDIVDHHTLSRHLNHPDSDSVNREWEETMKKLEKWKITFPELYFTLGNHDNIPKRQAATLGLNDRFIKGFAEIYNIPDGWIIDLNHIIDNVDYSHGLDAGGKYGAINKAERERRSVVVGHSHAYGGIKFSANNEDTVFGMNSGCLIDRKAYAFEYGRYSKFKPTLGCSIVYDDLTAMYIPLPKKYRE